MDNSGEPGLDLFVSHAGRDRAWAEWVAWQLSAAGYRVELDTWDWSTGEDFIERMRDALERASRVVALFSEAYFEPERFTSPEWTAVFAVRDGSGPRLVPVRIENVTPPVLLRALLFKDLFGLDVARARQVLLEAVGGARRPDQEPEFPPDAVARAAEAGPQLPGLLPAVFNVPPRSAAFTGRDGLLVALREALASGGPAAVALHGLGGVGKTTLAIEYAYRFASGYELVWWVDAERSELVGEQLADLGVAAGWVAADSDTPSAVRAVTQRLHRMGDWLIVLDNATGPEEVAKWLLPGPGHVVVTSRSPSWGHLASPVGVDVFTRAESVVFLSRLVPTAAQADVERIATALGDLPLALAQAAGVLAEFGMSAIEYVTELTTHADEVLGEGKPVGYPVPLAAAVRVAEQKLAEEDQAAAQLLRLCALLASEPVPIDVFAGAPPGVLAEPLATVVGSGVALRRSVSRLGQYGLAKVGPEGPQLHRLTQAILADSLDPATHLMVRDQVEVLLAAAKPDGNEDPATWPRWAALLPHWLAVGPVDSTNHAFRFAAVEAAFYLLVRGDFQPGRTLAAELYAQWRDRLGADDSDTRMAATALAWAHRSLGESHEAHVLDEDTLARCRRLLGDDHPDTLHSANNLAADLRDLGRVEEALALDEDTLARRRRLLGDDHPDTLASANNLTIDLRRLGRVEEALALALDEDTLARFRRVLGEDHPDTLASAYNLAVDLRRLGRVREALALDQDTLARGRRVLGEDHPDTLASANNLAVDLRDLGRVEEALALDEDTLARRRRLLGDDHPHTLESVNNLADDLRRLDRVREALAMDEDTLARCQRLHGDDHPATLGSANNLAVDLRRLGRAEEALSLDEDTLARCRRLLGDDHPHTLHSANNLATDLRDLGRVEDALAIDEDTLTRRRRLLGDDHPHTLHSANSLAADLRDLGRVEDALAIDEDTLTRRRRLLGDDHPDTLTSANNVADDLRRLGRVQEAQQIEVKIKSRPQPSPS